MGIPRFYRWLSERYPRINQRIEENVELLPEFDNMYLDANGIIHTCSHPNDEEVTSVRLTIEEMAMSMMGYIDSMVKIIRPKKVLFIAVDGCAPRAKMNQQRSRRFASARDSIKATQNAIDNGEMTAEEAAQRFDSNVITPGTPFMAELSRHFEFFLRKKLKEDPLWQHLEIIYSGHDVPGEGEHKVMEYIRRSRTEPGYDPNTRHCLCGLDADLMMLGLATHEPHFSLLREEVDFNSFARNNNRNATKEVKEQISKVKWQLLRISTLREYMMMEYQSVKQLFPDLSFERIVDDWVLMVMLVGNDFLPPIPSMDIFEGALDSLIQVHKSMLPSWKGHLTSDDGQLIWPRIESLFKQIGILEAKVFEQRETEQRERQRKANRSAGVVVEEDDTGGLENDDLLNDADEAILEEGDDLWSAEIKSKQRRRRLNYYREKFGVSVDDPDADSKIKDIARRYVEGLDWVHRYYYQGVPSWVWFYPFHYAPLASDVTGLVETAAQIKHIMGEPFKPFSQLLGCLPASSSHCLPPCYQRLMTSPDSPIIDFYPMEWEVDQNGKRNPWEWVNLLPFIDERKLAEAVSKVNQKELTEEERARNDFGKTYVFARDLSNNARLESTLKGMSAVDPCLSSKKEFTYSRHAIQSRHNPNLLTGFRFLPGDSTLTIHPELSPTASGLAFAKLNTFGSSSRKETFVLRFRASSFKSAEDVRAFFDAMPAEMRVWVNYPHLHEARIAKVEDVFGQALDVNEDGSRTWRDMTGNEKKAYDADAIHAATIALGGNRVVGTGGIELDRVFVMIRVRPFLGMKQDPDSGEMRQYFSEKENDTWIPTQLVLFENPLQDARFLDAPARPLSERFLSDGKVLCVADKGYGLLGTVVGCDENARQVSVRFPARVPKQNEYGHIIAQTIQDQFTTLAKIAQGLKLLPSVVDKFLGSLKVVDLLPRDKGRVQKVDLGLNLRVGKNRVIPGYAMSKNPESVSAAWKTGDTLVRVLGGLRGDEEDEEDTRNLASDSFVYTDRAIELLLRYKAKFPRLFERVSKKPNDNEYRKGELFNLQENPGEAEEVLQWLRQIPTYGVPLAPTSSRFMSRSAILSLQKAADEHVKREAAEPPPPELVINLPPHVLARPPTLDHGTIESPTYEIAPGLGDRVCNLGNPVIPFGLRGTVVATHPSTGAVHVVFDTPFMGGTALAGLCRPLHGSLLPAAHVLNLSKKSAVPLEGPVVKIARKISTPGSSTTATPARRTASSDSAKKGGGRTSPAGPSPAASKQTVAAAVPSSKLGGGASAGATPVSDVSSIEAMLRATTPSPSLPDKPPRKQSADSGEEDEDDLAGYFKQLMSSKLGKPVAAVVATTAAATAVPPQQPVSASKAAAAVGAPAPAAWTSKPPQKERTTPAKTASASKEKKKEPSKGAAPAMAVTSIAKRPAAEVESATPERVQQPAPVAQAAVEAVVSQPHVPQHQPQFHQQQQQPATSPMMVPGMHHPGQQPLFPPFHVPPQFMPTYMMPGAAPPPTLPIHVQQQQGLMPAVRTPSASSEKTSNLLDSVFKRAFKTENRVFEQQ